MPDKSEPEEPKGGNPTKGLDISTAETSWGFKGHNYLLTIGINRYHYWPPLKCAVKDVQDFAKVLTNRYQFDKDYLFTLQNEAATEQGILAMLRDIALKVTEEDNLVIYFSGHGHYDQATRTGYWIPVDARMGEENEYQFINTVIIFDKLRHINSHHTFLIIDACFSGTLIHQIKAAPRSERYKSRIVFTSGRAEVVMDGPPGGNSPFAKGILNVLRMNTDKHISASKLILEVKEYVEKEAQQTPTDARLINADDQGGSFVFHLKMSEAEIWADVVARNTPAAYQHFLEQFPESNHYHEAREACDWLVALRQNTIKSLKQYLDTYALKGTYTPLAIDKLEEIEEQQCWEKAMARDTLSAYYDYLYRYPEGEHTSEARKRAAGMGENEDDKDFKEAIEKNTPEAYREYIRKPGPRKYVTHVEKKLSELSLKSREPRQEEIAWEKTKSTATYAAYHDFIQAFPESPHRKEAQQESKRMDDIALNRIRLMEYNSSLTLQEIIDQCIAYFKEFPGAENNARVKQIKDRLVLKKYSRGN